MLNDEPIRVTLLVVDVLEKLGIEYVIGARWQAHFMVSPAQRWIRILSRV